MFHEHKRQRLGRLFLAEQVAVILIVACVGTSGYLTWYHLTHTTCFEADPELLSELEAASLEPAEPQNRETRDWPQWRGPDRTGLSSETGFLTAWPDRGLKVLWRARAGGGYSSFAVAGGKVYSMIQEGDNEAVVCWDAENGEEKWRFKYPARYDNDFGAGPRSTPTVDGPHVYTVGATGMLHCLNAETGEKVWAKDLLKEYGASNLQWGVSFSPLVDGDLILVNPGGPDGNSIAAIDKKTGKKVWSSQDDKAGYSSPVIATMADTRQVIFFTGTRLVGLSPENGKLYWNYPWETSYDCNIATPIVWGDYVFISSNYGKGCGLLKVSKRQDGSLKIERVYENNRMLNHFSTCVLYKGHLYGFSDPGLLTCMNFRTGEVKWSQRGFKKGSLLIADGHLIILGEDGKLALAEATEKGYRQKAAYQLLKGRCWTVPVLANGRLYARNQTEILCLDVRQAD